MSSSRGGENPRRVFMGTALVSLLAVFSLPGCHKRIRAEFDRPAAVSAVPAPAPPAEGPVAEEAPQVAAEPAEELPGPQEAEPPAARPVPRQRPSAPPLPPPPPEEHPSPRLTIDPSSSETGAIRDKLALTEAILSSLDESSLTVKQREQAAAARAFLTQARKALDEGDFRRASVLADKGLILAEDVREASRVSSR